MLPKATARAPSPARGTTISEPLKGRALVVESDKSESCAGLLEREGLEVLAATTGEEALRVAQEGHPELVVVDLGIAEGGGRELAMEMKLSPALARVPVIAIRSAPAPETGREQEVFDAYLNRPIEREELRRVVGEVLERRVKREVAARRDRPLKLKS